MKSVLKMTWMEAKLFLREPASAFFTLIFPLMMLFIYGTIFSNAPIPTPGGSQNAIGNLIPSFTAMSIGIVGLMPVTITLATYRETGVLRRLRTTPIHPLVVMAAQIIVVFAMTVLGVFLLVAAGKLIYHVQFTGNALSVFAGFVFASLSFFGMGFILASTMPTARTAQIVGMVVMYPMLILSGAGWPRELMPGAVVKISEFLPLTYVVNLLRGLWIGETWGQHTTDIVVLCVMFVVGAVISVKLFRWE
jgi:ABC-2 type transport system permease protein